MACETVSCLERKKFMLVNASDRLGDARYVPANRVRWNSRPLYGQKCVRYSVGPKLRNRFLLGPLLLRCRGIIARIHVHRFQLLPCEQVRFQEQDFLSPANSDRFLIPTRLLDQQLIGVMGVASGVLRGS